MELIIRNFRGLHNFFWAPQEGRINLLVGANGSGKSAVCAALHFLTWAWRASPGSAALDLFRTPQSLRLVEGTSSSHMGFKAGDMRWCVTIDAHNRSIRARSTCSAGGQTAKTLDVLDTYYDLFPLVYQSGCFQAAYRGLDNRLGRLLQDVMQDDAKKEFVEGGLTAAFPNQFEELVREAGGEVRVRERGSDAPPHLSEVSGGLLQLLGVLSAVACTPDGGIVVFDDPTSSLHPYAVKKMFERAEEWAWEHKITVLMMTHSEVLLNECAGSPDRVYMMKQYEQRIPTALTEVYDEDWLQGFSLGDLYSCDNIGSNADVPGTSELLTSSYQAPQTDWYDGAWFFAGDADFQVSLRDLEVGVPSASEEASNDSA